MIHCLLDGRAGVQACVDVAERFVFVCTAAREKQNRQSGAKAVELTLTVKATDMC